MSKVTYNGHNFYITPIGMGLPYGNGYNYDIFDDEGYRLVTNFAPEKLKQYHRAVDLIGDSDRNLKIVLDFAPYVVDSHTLQNNYSRHSLWAKPEYNLSVFWKYVPLM